jgi:hypothetical protein
MWLENQTKSRVCEVSSLCPETLIKNSAQEFHLWRMSTRQRLDVRVRALHHLYLALKLRRKGGRGQVGEGVTVELVYSVYTSKQRSKL